MTQLHYLMGQLQILYQGVFRNKRFAKINFCDRPGGVFAPPKPRGFSSFQQTITPNMYEQKINAAKLLDFLML